jgi:hypothetical protein
MGECVHDLERSSCAMCTPPAGAVVCVRGSRGRRRGRATAELYGVGPVVIAAYHGQCAGCGEHISPEDEIRSDGDGGWLCAACVSGDT